MLKLAHKNVIYHSCSVSAMAQLKLGFDVADSQGKPSFPINDV